MGLDMTRRPRLEHDFLNELCADALLHRGERVLIALSGGSDSVALFHLLRQAAVHLELRLHAAHLDHGIRPESGADAEFVRLLCARFDIPLVSERMDVPTLAATAGIGLEEAGRKARQRFLSACAARFACTAIALGHHRDDQAETVIHHLARGCAISGLAAMRRRSGFFVRPLLGHSKAELLAYLLALGEAFLVDASNDDLVFTRNRIRHQILPALHQLNPRIDTVLATLADCAAREDDFWQAEVARLYAELVTRGDDGLRLSIAALAVLHPAQRFRLLHRLLTDCAVAVGKEAGYRHIEAIDALLAAPSPQGELHLPGVRVLRRYDELLLLTVPLPSSSPWMLRVDGTGSYPLPDGRLLLVELTAEPGAAGADTVEFGAESLVFPLVVRTIWPGDRIHLEGMNGRKRLKELLSERKIPREERQRMILLEGEEILWIPGLRRCAGYRPVAGVPVYRISLHPGADRKCLECS